MDLLHILNFYVCAKLSIYIFTYIYNKYNFVAAVVKYVYQLLSK